MKALDSSSFRIIQTSLRTRYNVNLVRGRKTLRCTCGEKEAGGREVIIGVRYWYYYHHHHHRYYYYSYYYYYYYHYHYHYHYYYY